MTTVQLLVCQATAYHVDQYSPIVSLYSVLICIHLLSFVFYLEYEFLGQEPFLFPYLHSV